MAFAPHLLDQDRDLHFASAADVKDIRGIGLLDPQRHVGTDLFDQTFPDMAGRHKLAVNACQGAIVYGELHLNRGWIDGHEGQGSTVFGIRDRFPNENVLKAGNADDVAGVSFGDFNALEALEMEDGSDFGFALAAITVNAHERLTHFYLAAVDFAKGDTAEVIGIIQVSHHESESFARMRARRGNVFNDGIKQWLHRAG